MILFRLNLLFYFISFSLGCLPNPYGYSPGYGGYYAPTTGYGYGIPRVGPFRSEPQRGPNSAAVAAVAQSAVHPRFASQQDEIKSISTLNCALFTDHCRWSNTQEEELDWTTVAESPQSSAFISTLESQNLPDQSAAILVSLSRKGWEGGQLVSDPLPCINEGLKVTATAWKSRLGSTGEQPKLQICTKNTNEEKFPLVNCNDFDIRNGVPISVEVPPPNNPFIPAQIVFYGNNFIAQEGGAIFLQDIVVEGSLKCNGETLDSHPILVNQPPMKSNDNEKRSFSETLGPLKGFETNQNGLEAIDAVPSSFVEEQRMALSALQNQLQFNNIAANNPNPLGSQVQQVPIPPQPASETLSGVPSLFETCLSLSCNPSDLSCKFWRSAGNNRWEIGISGRVANPLTGIHLPPGTAQKFLVAPFYDSHISSYTLVSEQLNIPLLEEVYFCFYEYYATEGLSIAVCTDKMDCFYKKNSLAMGDELQENKKWNIRCTKLPPGTYELRVIAENSGENKGEVGFLPIRLSHDGQGQQLIC